MPTYGLTIETSHRDVDVAIRKVAAAIDPEHLTQFMVGRAEPYLHERILQRFAGEGDEVSGSWDPLRYSTQQIRSMLGYEGDHPINVRTGDLKRWLTETATVADNEGGLRLTIPGDSSSQELEQKLSTAQIGRADPKTRPRPVIGLGLADEEAIVGNLRAFIIEAMAA